MTKICKNCGKIALVGRRVCQDCKNTEQKKAYGVAKDTRTVASSGVCKICKKEKSSDSFSKAPRKRNGLASYCLDCIREQRKIPEVRQQRLKKEKKYRDNNSDKLKTWGREYRRENPHMGRKWHLSARYGLSLEQFDALVKKQSGCCAICSGASKLVVDHCHATGKVRGLLCPNCNHMLGHAKDMPGILERASVYLLKAGGFIL